MFRIFSFIIYFQSFQPALYFPCSSVWVARGLEETPASYVEDITTLNNVGKVKVSNLIGPQIVHIYIDQFDAVKK